MTLLEIKTEGEYKIPESIFRAHEFDKLLFIWLFPLQLKKNSKMLTQSFQISGKNNLG